MLEPTTRLACGVAVHVAVRVLREQGRVGDGTDEVSWVRSSLILRS